MKIEKRITAREAHNLSIGKEEYRKIMEDVYDTIREAVKFGATNTSYWIDEFNLASLVFHELTIQGYNTVQTKEDAPGLKQWRIDIDWEDVDLDPNTKYILPMEDTEARMGSKLYAFKVGNQWCAGFALNDAAAIDYKNTVTAKDIEESPDWVKALDPVEVEE